MTLWHGISRGTGLRRMAWPTARDALSWPLSRASSWYDTVRPYGTFDTRHRHTAVVKFPATKHRSYNSKHRNVRSTASDFNTIHNTWLCRWVFLFSHTVDCTGTNNSGNASNVQLEASSERALLDGRPLTPVESRVKAPVGGLWDEVPVRSRSTCSL